MNFLALAGVLFSITFCIVMRRFNKQFLPVQLLFGTLLVAYGAFELYNLLAMKTSILGQLRYSLYLKISWYAFFYLLVIYIGVSQFFRKKHKNHASFYQNNVSKFATYAQQCGSTIYDIFAREAQID